MRRLASRMAGLALVGGAGLALLGEAAPALADPTPLVTAPSGWRADPEQASALAQRFAATSHFGGSTARAPAQSTMSAAGEAAQTDERVRLRPMAIPQDARSNDRRTAYVGAGVVVLAVLFWWNRRRRDRFEREDRGAPAHRASRDEDADDLHAAARIEAPEPPDRRDQPDRPDRPDRRDRRDPT